jgi:hypothetical protein
MPLLYFPFWPTFLCLPSSKHRNMQPSFTAQTSNAPLSEGVVVRATNHTMAEKTKKEGQREDEEGKEGEG